MKVIAVVLCLAAVANAASVYPLESSVVKSDRVGDNFSYSIHQNHGYAVSSDVKQVVPAATPYVAQQPVVSVASPVEVKQHVVPAATTYVAQQPAVVSVAQQHVVPVDFKQHVVPAATTYVAQQPAVVSVAQQPVVSVAAPAVEVKHHYTGHQVVAPVEVQTTELKHVVPATAYVAAKPTTYYATSPVKSYVKNYVSAAAVPVAQYYPYAAYPYAAYAYPYVNSEKVY
ncbi:hypothetical protein C0J52_16459 [Blattella germanica]|nr:hypothetical protein C0J52_16459 [Blattella germanica]